MFINLLVKIKNGHANKAKCIRFQLPLTKAHFAFLSLLYKEGFINGWESFYDDSASLHEVKLKLKYDTTCNRMISYLKLISKPSLRVYATITSL